MANHFPIVPLLVESVLRCDIFGGLGVRVVALWYSAAVFLVVAVGFVIVVGLRRNGEACSTALKL